MIMTVLKKLTGTVIYSVFLHFSYIITTFIITVLQILSMLSNWGIIVFQYAVHKIDRKYFFIRKKGSVLNVYRD